MKNKFNEIQLDSQSESEETFRVLIIYFLIKIDNCASMDHDDQILLEQKYIT